MSRAMPVTGNGLSMDTIQNFLIQKFLWPIIAIGGFGGLGALIDFLIGKAGQEKARDWLLKWWMKFDDVRWGNFGKEEALFAVAIIDRWFGTKIWSIRRNGLCRCFR